MVSKHKKNARENKTRLMKSLGERKTSKKKDESKKKDGREKDGRESHW